MKGLTLEVTGDSNDYVGKGLSGATIILKPFAHLSMESWNNTIIGNTCLYGATSGSLFAAGQAAERFAVRNSGATAVIEGCGSNGCEYMTGGKVAILGEVGDNFGAGMSGGMAFVYDPDNRFEKVVNSDSVNWYRIQSPHWENVLKKMIQEHYSRTDSRRAFTILDQWETELPNFRQIVPKEMINRLDHPVETNTEVA